MYVHVKVHGGIQIYTSVILIQVEKIFEKIMNSTGNGAAKSNETR